MRERVRRGARWWQSVTAKTCLAAVIVAGCSALIDLREPTFDEAGRPGADAAVDAIVDLPRDAAPDVSPPPPIDAGIDAFVCVPSECTFGCDPDTNACRRGKLWIFRTGASFVGNGFGGADMPPNVRGGADARCLSAYMASHQARQCNPSNVHAVVHIGPDDLLDDMATRFGIPASTPMHRADDDVLVTDSWLDLIDGSKVLRAPATTAMTDSQAVVWTGAFATCANWTSGGSADNGTRGFTNRTDATWLRRDNARCDSLVRLLCICW